MTIKVNIVEGKTGGPKLSIRMTPESYIKFDGGYVEPKGTLATGLRLVRSSVPIRGLTWKLTPWDGNKNSNPFVFLPARFATADTSRLFTTKATELEYKILRDGSFKFKSFDVLQAPGRKAKQYKPCDPQPLFEFAKTQNASTVVAKVEEAEVVNHLEQDRAPTPMDNLRSALAVANELVDEVGAVRYIREDGTYGATLSIDV